ncbi:MAG TPA: acyl-CoA reductase [Burkholderiaceae bacterium]|jgi:hypothetical protein|nr:acyl-CoA reductase [Burkholderiaceae bacterium]
MTPTKVAACYLPGLAPESLRWHTLSFGSGARRLDVDVPLLDSAQLSALAERVRQASQEHLKRFSASEIVDVIGRAIARLLDPQDPYRRQAEQLLPVVTGLDPEMVRLGLTSYLKTFRAPQLHKFLAEDFANPKLLDEFQPRPKGGWAKAIGPDLLVHVWAGNVPGLPLWSLISGLLVKAGAIGKVSSDEPLFAGWFARLLAEVEPRLAECFAIVWWKGGDEAIESSLFAQADAVLAYGGKDALDKIRRRVPAATRFLPHGYKLSFAMVSAQALEVRQASATARLAALDVARYEQQGCYSPHVFYVARGGKVSPREFAHQLAGELAALQHKFPRRPLPLEDGVSVANWRQTKEFESMTHAGLELLGDAVSPWSIAFSEEPKPLAPTALNRTVSVVAVDQLREAIPLVVGQRAFLQTIGLAAPPEELFALADSLGQAGVTRICAIGAMTAPEAGWHHDGRFSLLDLVRMVEIEQSAESAAEAFTSYRD